MIQIFKELFRGKPGGLENKPVRVETVWAQRCQSLFKTHESARYLGSPKLRDASLQKTIASGEKIIQEITQVHGKETVESLLREVDGASLWCQLDLLHLAQDLPQTVNPTYLINALKWVPKETREDWKNIFSPQDKLYDYVLEEILSQRDGEDQFARFKKRVWEVKLSPEEESHKIHKPYQWRTILKTAIDKGLPFMMEALDFIPPEEIFPENISERLALEREIRVTGEKPVEREIIFSGTVQDVGFRGKCWEVAKKWGVKGLARNEIDGTVTVIIQGEPKRLSRFWEEFERSLWQDQKAKIGEDHALGQQVYTDLDTF